MEQHSIQLSSSQNTGNSMVVEIDNDSQRVIVPTRVTVITPEQTWPLRKQVLRPMQRLEELDYVGDRTATTKHFGIEDQTGNIVGVASVYLESMPNTPTEKAQSGWRLRGMATAPLLRRKGGGSMLLQAACQWIRDQGAAYLWCNARQSAYGFYSRHGFESLGAEFEIPGLGIHRVMVLKFESKFSELQSH